MDTSSLTTGDATQGGQGGPSGIHRWDDGITPLVTAVDQSNALSNPHSSLLCVGGSHSKNFTTLNQLDGQSGTVDLPNSNKYTFDDIFAESSSTTTPFGSFQQVPVGSMDLDDMLLAAFGSAGSQPTGLPASSGIPILASRRGNTVLPAITMPPLSIPAVIEEPIEHTFPSADSKRLFQHVRSKTFTVIVALGSGDHQIKNPFMAMTIRLMLLDPKSAAQTAFRHSLLSLGAAHVGHQHERSSPDQCQQMRVRTVKSKRKAILHLFMNPGKQEESYTDLMLATCLTLYLRNVSVSLSSMMASY